jgi:hypothetical protein
MLAARMKLLFAAIVVLLIAASFYADYRWKRWIAARRAERENNPQPNSGDR